MTQVTRWMWVVRGIVRAEVCVLGPRVGARSVGQD